MGRYILDADGNPVREPNFIKWARWYETADRRVAYDELAHGHVVSTIFPGLDHSFRRLLGVDEPPILWETIVFNDYGALDVDWAIERYATRAEALVGHAAALTELKLYLQTEASDER